MAAEFSRGFDLLMEKADKIFEARKRFEGDDSFSHLPVENFEYHTAEDYVEAMERHSAFIRPILDLWDPSFEHPRAEEIRKEVVANVRVVNGIFLDNSFVQFTY